MAAASSLVPFDDNNGYVGTENNSGQAVGSGKERMRTLNMPSGQKIWDFSGNAYEWVRYIESDGTLDSEISGNSATHFNSRNLPSTGSIPKAVTYDLITSDWQNTAGNLISGSLFIPSLSTFIAGIAQRLGYIYLENSTDPYYLLMGSGMYENGNRGGVFSIDAYSSNNGNRPSYSGFRCVSEPQ